jgi:hypothetical protein
MEHSPQGTAHGSRTAAFIALISAVGASAAVAAAALSYPDGPPPGYTGGFGEASCHACHFEAQVNEKPGSLTIAGVPEFYAPGRTYPIRLTLTRPGMALGGFQLSARFEGSETQAGAFAPGADSQGRVSVVESYHITYAQHRLAGAMPVAPDTVRWTLVWTAPAGGGPVLFHAAGTAADGDDTISGDYVFTTHARAQASKAPQ